MTMEDWLANACADADRRGLPDLKPLLASLADATRELRSGGWDTRGGDAAHASRPDETAPASDGSAR
jgi:hypothetical protein